MGIEKLGVIVKNPDLTVAMDAASYGNLLGYLFSHGYNLSGMVKILNTVNPDGANEVLSEMQGHLYLMTQALHGVLNESIRIAVEQGVEFQEISPAASTSGLMN